MTGNWLRSVEELKLASFDQGVRVLGVSSPLPGAGTSRLAASLAEVLSRSGARTLLVDLARPSDPDDSAPLWRGWMRLVDQTGPAEGLTVRAIRQSMATALSRLRMTQAAVYIISLACSDVANYAIRHARPRQISLRLALVGTVLRMELIHDGGTLPSLETRLLAAPDSCDIAPDDPELPILLAGRELMNWEYLPGPTSRLIGWRQLDDAGPQLPPPRPYENRIYDRIVANPRGHARLQFNNTDQMRKLLREELSDYEAVVVDLPPVLDNDPTRINPLAAAAACDGVHLLCLSGKIDRDSLTRSVALVRQSGANVLGLVLNDAENPTLGAEIAREARRLRRLLPSVSAWIERKALSSDFLN